MCQRNYGNFGHNQQIEIFTTYNAQSDFMKKRYDVMTDSWQWRIKEDSEQDDQQK
jgi:hypothetical protein